RDREADQGEARDRRPGRRRGRAAARSSRLLSMVDGQVARLDGIDGRGEANTSTPVARFGELLGTEEAPAVAGSSDATEQPVAQEGASADLHRIGTSEGTHPAPVADLAASAADGGQDGPVALFESPSLGAGRDDVAVVELG